MLSQTTSHHNFLISIIDFWGAACYPLALVQVWQSHSVPRRVRPFCCAVERHFEGCEYKNFTTPWDARGRWERRYRRQVRPGQESESPEPGCDPWHRSWDGKGRGPSRQGLRGSVKEILWLIFWIQLMRFTITSEPHFLFPVDFSCTEKSDVLC